MKIAIRLLLLFSFPVLSFASYPFGGAGWVFDVNPVPTSEPWAFERVGGADGYARYTYNGISSTLNNSPIRNILNVAPGDPGYKAVLTGDGYNKTFSLVKDSAGKAAYATRAALPLGAGTAAGATKLAVEVRRGISTPSLAKAAAKVLTAAKQGGSLLKGPYAEMGLIALMLAEPYIADWVTSAGVSSDLTERQTVITNPSGIGYCAIARTNMSFSDCMAFDSTWYVAQYSGSVWSIYQNGHSVTYWEILDIASACPTGSTLTNLGQCSVISSGAPLGEDALRQKLEQFIPAAPEEVAKGLTQAGYAPEPDLSPTIQGPAQIVEPTQTTVTPDGKIVKTTNTYNNTYNNDDHSVTTHQTTTTNITNVDGSTTTITTNNVPDGSGSITATPAGDGKAKGKAAIDSVLSEFCGGDCNTPPNCVKGTCSVSERLTTLKNKYTLNPTASGTCDPMDINMSSQGFGNHSVDVMCTLAEGQRSTIKTIMDMMIAIGFIFIVMGA